jgi:hypothetical protein
MDECIRLARRTLKIARVFQFSLVLVILKIIQKWVKVKSD